MISFATFHQRLQSQTSASGDLISPVTKLRRPHRIADSVRYAKIALIALTGGFLAACASHSPVRSNHAVSYQGLVQRNDQAIVIPPKQADLGHYRWAIIEPILVEEAVSSEIPADTSEEVLDVLQNIFEREVRQSFGLVERTSGEPTVIFKVRITRITEASPALNVLTTVLIAPLRNGALAAEVEAIDAESGRQLALMLWADSGGVAKDFFGNFTRSTHARALATQFAIEANAFMAPLSIAGNI